MHFYFLIIVPT